MREPAEAQATIASARQESLQGREHRQASPDLVVGLGSYEIAHQVLGRTPRPQHEHRFFFLRNYGSGESKLMVAIHLPNP